MSRPQPVPPRWNPPARLGPATPTITGRTRLVAHIGVPTETFTAPMIYNPYFADRGIDAVVVPMGCAAPDYEAFLPLVFRLTNIAGALITMPHKVVTASLVNSLSPAARICGACNAVRNAAGGGLHGDMFDGAGFVRAVHRMNHSVSGAAALVVGAGGVGSAIAAALADAGAAHIAIHDVRSDAAERLAARMSLAYPAVRFVTGNPDPEGCSLVVNATPLGTVQGDPLPIAVQRIGPTALVGDVVLGAADTPFVAAARHRGHRVITGTQMLFEMIPAYLEFFGLPTTTSDELRRLAQIVR